MRSPAALPLILAAALAAHPASAQTGGGRRIERTGKTAEVKAGGDRWAVLVGIDEYQAKTIDPLSGAVGDAKAVREALIKYADFPEGQAFLLASDGATKPTKTDIMVKLEEIKSAAKPTDLLLFFFAGHGVQVDGQRYLLTYDARIDNAALIKTTALPASELMAELESLKVAHRVIMIDACRNDPTKPGKKPNMADEAFEMVFSMPSASEGGVRATFLSCSKGQSAYEWTEKRRGFFSLFIEKGLSGEAAQYGKVTVTSLLGYLNEMVPQKVREQKNQLQIPYAKVDGSELVLVRPDKLPAAVPSLDKQPAAAPPRTLYGVIKDSNGVPLAGASITVALTATGRGQKPTPSEMKVTTDEDGFFKVDGVPPDVEAKVTASKDSYVPKTLTTTPAEAGKKMVVFLPKAEPAKPVAVADLRPAPAPPTTAAPAARPPVTAAPAPARPTPAPAKPTPAAAPATPKQAAPTPPPSQPPAPPVVSVTARADELALVAYRTFLAEDYKEAENAARIALQADADNPLANAVLGNAMAALGINTGDPKKTAAAKEFIARALDKDAKQALGHSARGLTLFAEGRASEAQSAFEKAVQLDPKLGTAHSNLGYILSSQNRLPEAERECREAIRLQPESAVPYNCLSDVLFKMGKYKDAVKACRDAIGRYELRDTLLGLYYVQLGVAQFQQGKQNEALEAVARAKALGVATHPAFATIEKGAKKKG